MKNDRSLLFSFFHSSTAMTPFRAGTGYSGYFLFVCFCIFLLLLLTQLTLLNVITLWPLYLNVTLMGDLFWFLFITVYSRDSILLIHFTSEGNIVHFTLLQVSLF